MTSESIPNPDQSVVHAEPERSRRDVLSIPPMRRLSVALAREVRDDDVAGACAEVAYYALFAVPPMLVLLTALAALIDHVTAFPMAARLRSLIIWNAPGDTLSPLLAFVDHAVEEVDSGTASFTIIAASAVAVWAGANAVRALFKAFNRAYDVIETRSYHRLRLLSLGLAMLAPAAIVGAFGLWIFGSQAGRWMGRRFALGADFRLAWDLLRWPAAVLLFLLALGLLYYIGTNVNQSFRWIIPGALLATLLWFLMILGFKLYLLIARPGGIYGTFASVILTVTLFYLTAATIILGAELNALLARRYDPATVTDLVRQPHKIDRLKDIIEAQQHALEFDAREQTNIAGQLAAPATTIQILPKRVVHGPPDHQEHRNN
ncbi:hypothetical protein BH23CHL2_BH23CHL2_23140 [soil metagenome]